MRLYWGALRREDFYMLDRIARWQQRPPWFSFVPVLSRAGSNWNGRSRFVQRAALADHPDASGVDVYACGNPLMVSAALRELREEAGLAAANF